MRHLLAVLALLAALPAAATAAGRLQDYEARNETLQVAGREADRVTDRHPEYGTQYSVTGCTRKTATRFSCRYKLDISRKIPFEWIKTCQRRVTVRKTHGVISSKLIRLGCEPA